VPALAWGDGTRCCGVIESGVLTNVFFYFYFRFFETEGIAIMTMLVSRYKIEVKEEPEFVGESFEERYARVMTFDRGLTTM
jgi:hypothetical protein